MKLRKLWYCTDWSIYISKNKRSGIRMRFDKNVDVEVKRACKEYVQWLKSIYRFPVRVPIYFKETKYIKTSSKDLVSAVFFGPNDLMVEPYIKIAVGDYNDLCKVQGKDDALAAILCSITHELTHYFQWIKYHELWLSGEKTSILKDKQCIMADKLFMIMQIRENILNFKIYYKVCGAKEYFS